MPRKGVFCILRKYVKRNNHAQRVDEVTLYTTEILQIMQN